MSRILVTGGSGFVGSGLVKALVKAGHSVRVLDDNSRGSPRRLAEVAKDIEFVASDIRDAAQVEKATQGVDEVHHLAFVNGTEFFYSQPDLVLDVGVAKLGYKPGVPLSEGLRPTLDWYRQNAERAPKA